MTKAVKPIKPGTSYSAIVGQILAKNRVALGLDQVTLAGALDLKQAAWSRVENGQVSLSVEQLKLAAQRLRTTADVILAEADQAETYLRSRGVSILSQKQTRNNDLALALLVGAALGLLLLGALKKK